MAPGSAVQTNGLEQLAELGGVLISGTAYDHLQGKLACFFDYLGERAAEEPRPPGAGVPGWPS